MKNKILFVLCVLFGLMFINGGLNKIFNYMPPPDDMSFAAMRMFKAMMDMGWLMPLLATAEVVGGVLFIIPRFRALGAVILAPIMFGINLAHINVAPEGLPLSIGLTAIWLWVIIENKEKYMPMIGE